jgi:hypothetical protein
LRVTSRGLGDVYKRQGLKRALALQPCVLIGTAGME